MDAEPWNETGTPPSEVTEAWVKTAKGDVMKATSHWCSCKDGYEWAWIGESGWKLKWLGIVAWKKRTP